MTKKKIDLDMTIQINRETGKVSAAYFYIRKGKSAHVREFADGAAFADYDRKGNLLGVELLAPCQITVLDKIARREPAPVKTFLKGSIPREMALVGA